MYKQAVLILFLIISTVFPQATIAILDFDANGLSESEANIISVKLENVFLNNDSNTIIERNKINEILKEQGFQQTGCTATECAVEIGKVLNVSLIVIGSASKFGSIYSINAKLIDIKTGKIIKSAEYNSDNRIEDLLLYGVSQIYQQLTGSQMPENKKSVASELHLKNEISIMGGFNMAFSNIEIDDPDEVALAYGSRNISMFNKGFLIALIYRLRRHEFGLGFSQAKGEYNLDKELGYPYIVTESLIGVSAEYGFNLLPLKSPIKIVTGIKVGYWSIIIDTDTINVRIPANFGPHYRFEATMFKGISIFASHLLQISLAKKEVSSQWNRDYKATLSVPVSNIFVIGLSYSIKFR